MFGIDTVFIGNLTPNAAAYNDPKRVEIEGKRHLRWGEKQMARTIFKESIDYDIVYICRGTAFHNITGIARTIGNEISFPAKVYEDIEDFSASGVSVEMQNWLIRELTHVWQHQLDYPIEKTGICLAAKFQYAGKDALQNGETTSQPPAYAFDVIKDDKDLPDYNMEQQAEIISQYFTIQKKGSKAKFYNLKNNYKKILKQFLDQPKDKLLLPRNRGLIDC